MSNRNRLRLKGFRAPSNPGLPQITNWSVAAVDPHTAVFTVTLPAEYVSYRLYMNGEIGTFYVVDENDHLHLEEPGATYSFVPAGVTAGGIEGPRGVSRDVTLPAEDPGPEPEPGIVALPADTFIDQFGINTNFTFGTAIWADDPEVIPIWRDAILDAGFRRVRTLIGQSGGPGNLSHKSYKFMQELIAGNPRMKFDAMIATANGGAYQQTQNNNRIENIRAFGPEFFAYTECGNEFQDDSFGLPADNATAVALTIAETQRLYDRFRGFSDLDDIPVIGPSVHGRDSAVIDMIVSQTSGAGFACDLFPLHYYNGGRWPGIAGIPFGGDENGGDAEVTFQFTYDDHERAGPGKPCALTEWGWSAISPHYPTYANYPNGTAGIVTEEVQADYTLLGMAYYTIVGGVQFCNLYASVNNTTATNYGMVDQLKQPVAGDFDPRTRPMQTRIKRLFALYDDPGAPLAGTLNFQFTGNVANGNLFHQLRRRRDGKFLIIKGLGLPLWNRANGITDRVLAPTRTGALHFPDGAVTNVKLHQPHVSATPIDLGGGQTFNRTFPAQVEVFEITL